MKKTLLSALLGLFSVVAFAQASISVTLDKPALNDNVIAGTAFDYEITVTNNGSTAISEDTLIEAIEKVCHDGYHITSNFANQINKNVDLHRPRNAYGTLSSREIEVLKFLIDGKRNIEIAHQLKTPSLFVINMNSPR